MITKVYNIDTNKKRINFVIREIIRNKYKNIKIYAPIIMELELIPSIEMFFKNAYIQPISNYTPLYK